LIVPEKDHDLGTQEKCFQGLFFPNLMRNYNPIVREINSFDAISEKGNSNNQYELVVLPNAFGKGISFLHKAFGSSN
jgi:hypothetical protein